MAYHRRLQSLLLREDVQQVLNATVKVVPRKALSNLSVNSVSNAEVQLTESTNEANLSRNQALSNIKKQEDTIESKLQRRKSMRNTSFPMKIEGDRCAGSKDRYENALVDVMEKFLTEKISKTQEIQKIYGVQMQEIREMGNNSIINEILKQMESSMSKEIDELCKSIESEKVLAIAKIKDVNRYGY